MQIKPFDTTQTLASTAPVVPKTGSTSQKPVQTPTEDASPQRASARLDVSDEGVILAKQLQRDSATRDTIYDQPSGNNARAIATYIEFANQTRREEVQSLLGVDLYA